MNKATILITGGNTARHAALVEQLGNQFYSLTAANEEAAIDRFLQSPVDAVVFDDTVNDATRAKLIKLFGAQQPNTVFIPDNGAGIVDEINNAVTAKQKENKPAFSFKDDALKNAGLNIEIQ